MEKRKVTILVGGQPCRFYSDDSEEYLSALAERANAVMRQTAKFSGASNYANAVLSVLSLTDSLMRTEQELRAVAAGKKETAVRQPSEAKRPADRKAAAKALDEGPGQVTVWDLLV